MNLTEYLRTRHKTVNALTRAEADIIGLNYPLEGGWVKKYGSLEIPDEIVLRLRKARTDRKEKVASNKAKAKKRRLEPKPLKMTKTQKKAQNSEVARLVIKILAQGCSNAERMAEHLNKASRP